MTAGRVGMGLMFSPRGGSAQVARYLSRALGSAGWDVRLAAGSLGAAGEPTHAATFFRGLHVEPADYTPARERFEHGADHLAGPMPFHPSFEDREGAPDPVFAALGPEQTEAQIEAWAAVLERAGFADVDLIHLHHLTPMHDAVARRFPEHPVVTHLHGTDLKMLDRIGRLEAIARARGTTLAALAGRTQRPGSGTPISADQAELLERTRLEQYAHGSAWAVRLSAAAARSRRIICISPHDASEAVRLLGVPERLIEVIPNGVDTDLFAETPLGASERLDLLRRWLVDDPQGWDESGQPGSIRYLPQQLEAFSDPAGNPIPVLVFVGRFLAFKRVPLLVRAYARARRRLAQPAPLVVWGGSPGEWEGEHPHAVAQRESVDGVFFTGWRGHDELPLGLSAAHGFVAPSVNEPFGQVFLEAMSCGLPVVATRTGGPPSFVNTVPAAPNGWLVEPDDPGALADALVALVNSPDERAARGRNARAQVRSRYAWDAVVNRFTAIYRSACSR
ncbi:MAG: glycosyltransferase [Actinomycetia bacterium]|nr:glycosyltransferase [Actinomycetes bacterium]